MGAELNVEGREKLIKALASGATVTEAARVSGYHRVHAHKLMRDPEFRAEIERARRQVPEPDDVAAAKKILRRIADGDLDGRANDLAVRVQAAKALILAYQARIKGPVVATPAPVVKILPAADGDKAAQEWMERQA